MPDPNKWFTNKIDNYYQQCREIYQSNNGNSNTMTDIYQMGPFDNFYDIAEKVSYFSEEIRQVFDSSPNQVSPNSKIAHHQCQLFYKSSDKKNILAKYIQQLPEHLSIELQRISLHIIELLQPNLQTYLMPYNHVIYRNIKIKQSTIKNNPVIFGEGAWSWHCDHDPPFKFKIFTYLNDIDDKRAPFEIVHHPQKKLYPKMIPYGSSLWSWAVTGVNYDKNNISTKPYFLTKPSTKNIYNIAPNTRIPPNTMKQLLQDGYVQQKITAKKGTMFPTQTGLIHRANVAQEGYRDILVLECVPCKFKIDTDNFTHYFKPGIDTVKLYQNLIKNS